MNPRYSTDHRNSLHLYQARDAVDLLWLFGLLVAALCLFGINLGGLPLRDWDEGTVAQVARDLWRSPFASASWLYPTQGGEPYLNKPPLMHWLIAIAYHLGGVNEWTTRLPGALSSAFSVPLLYSVGRELFARRTPAVFAALMYLTLLPVVRHGRLAMLDGAVLCFSLVMMLCLLRSRRDLRWTLGVGIGLGLICFVKGILGLLLGAIAVVFLGWDTPRLLKSPYLWWGVLLGSLPVWCWYGVQFWHYGESFVQHTVQTQSWNRVWSVVENNSGAPWYYLWEISKISWPWLVFWPTGCWYAWQNRNLSWAKFSLVWSGLYFCAISVMGTKLPWYSLPLYPPLALMGGMQLAQVWRSADLTGLPSETDFAYPQAWVRIFAVLSSLCWGGWGYFSWLGSASSSDLRWVLAAFAFTLTVTTVLIAFQDAQFIAVLIWGTYVSLLLLMQSEHWIWELAEAYPVKPIAAIVQKAVPIQQTVYTSFPDSRPSLDFYSDRRVLPATDPQLRGHWQQPKPPYLLLEGDALERLQLKPIKVLGRHASWLLVTRAPVQSSQKMKRGLVADP
jgi:4-amino-4-deoxy-L-arabinose transferase-like glycosyltransferase